MNAREARGKDEGSAAATNAATVTAPRQRPGTAVLDKGRQSVSAALDAAGALLAEEGAAGLSTRKVAARAGMHAGNLQYYFRTRQDLVRALLERYLDQSRERVGRRIAAAEGPAAARLRSGLEEILSDQCAAADCAMFREVWAMASHDAEIAAALAGFYRAYVVDVAAMLREAAPCIPPAKVARAATMVVAMLEGLSLVEDAPARSAAARRKAAAEIADAAIAIVKAA